VNTKETNTTAHSPAHSGATRRTPRRPSKLVLLRVKVTTMIVAVVLFFASLAGIAVYNPGVSHQPQTPVPVQQITIVKPGGSGSVVVPPPPHVTPLQPLVRSRGSRSRIGRSIGMRDRLGTAGRYLDGEKFWNRPVFDA
jgi:hypothetical protein